MEGEKYDYSMLIFRSKKRKIEGLGRKFKAK